MVKQEMIPKPANPKFHAAAKSHRLCLDQLIDAHRVIDEKSAELTGMEDRLEATFDDARAVKKELEDSKEKWQTEKCDLKAKIKQLEEDLKYEKRRAVQAMGVASLTSDAAGGIGRLLNRIVDNDVMETLRLAAHDQREEAKQRLRHRSPG